jgi:hypothetical protein
VGHPPFVIAENPGIVKAERPELYAKLKIIIEYVNRITVKGWSGKIVMDPAGFKQD